MLSHTLKGFKSIIYELIPHFQVPLISYFLTFTLAYSITFIFPYSLHQFWNHLFINNQSRFIFRYTQVIELNEITDFISTEAYALQGFWLHVAQKSQAARSNA